MQSLFPQRNTTVARTNSNVLISFPAGKCQLQLQADGKYLVTPEPRKGTLSLERDNDRLTHFIWTDRTSGIKEDDLIVFPDQISFKKAKTGRPNDRIYCMRYISSTQYLFFWMQDKSPEKDNEYCNKISEYTNNPTSADAALSALTTSGNPTSANPMDGLGQDSWLQSLGLSGMPGLDSSLLGGNAASGPVHPTLYGQSNTVPSSSSQAPGALGNLDLSNILRQFNFQPTSTISTTSPSLPTSLTTQLVPIVPEADVDTPVESSENTPYAINSILNDNEAIDQLLLALPSNQRTVAHLREIMSSSAFNTILVEVQNDTINSSTTTSQSPTSDAVASGISNMTIDSPHQTLSSREKVLRDVTEALTRLFYSSASEQDFGTTNTGSE